MHYSKIERDAAHEGLACLAAMFDLMVVRGAPDPILDSDDGRHPPSRIDVAMSWIKRRRLRDRFFPAELFADPAWDMLLDLYVAHHQGRCIGVSSAAIASNVPPTTALRWIAHMERAGFFAYSRDKQDRRRRYVALAPSAIEAMDALMDAAGTDRST